MFSLFRRIDGKPFHLIHSQRFLASNQFVPTHNPVQKDDIKKLENFLRDKSNVLVLTGAGISTESGKKVNPRPFINSWLLERSLCCFFALLFLF